MKQPLEGIRVLELAMYHAGPGTGAILGDLGAEVIKIEMPVVGDPARRSSFVGNVDLGLPNDVNVWHEGANRGKKSITLGLYQEEGREVAYRLAKQSDVFITSWRQPALEKMRMTYDILAGIHPSLIYASVSGYGPNGPDRNVGGFDFQGQARSGLMFSVGSPDDPPLASQFGIVDQTTSIMLSHAIITALLMRERTGIGQQVNISLLSTALYMQYMNILIALTSGREIMRSQRTKEYPLRNYYRCSDDNWFMMTIPSASGEVSWHQFCNAIGQPDLTKDSRFETIEKIRVNGEHLVSLLDTVFATRPRDEWLKLFAEYDFPVAPVHKHSELKDDSQIVANQYIVDFDHPKLGVIKIPGYPIHFSKAYAGTRSAAPALGQDTEAVLTEIGGYTQKEIAQLKQSGVI